jgi:hypothetical protein
MTFTDEQIEAAYQAFTAKPVSSDDGGWSLRLALRAALEAADAAAWRPIAEAPKDGTHLLIGIAGGKYHACDAWYDGFVCDWITRRSGSRWTRVTIPITHFRPLPSPPKGVAHDAMPEGGR